MRVEKHLGCFHFLGVVSRVAMNMVEESFVGQVVGFFGHVLTSGIAGVRLA